MNRTLIEARAVAMWITISYANGVTVNGVILAANGERMRIILASQRDAADLHRVDGCWFTENQEAITIESLIGIPGVSVSESGAIIYPLAFAARCAEGVDGVVTAPMVAQAISTE
jgi:hypothetical protein